MLVPISWLKEYTKVDVDIDTFCEQMIMSGSNIETAERFGEDIKGVVTGRVLQLEKHPDADKLFVVKVDIGSEVLNIVTGADNLFVGALVPVATHGSTLPGEKKILRGKLRGIESNGMLCSVKELGFEDKVIPVDQKDGIFILGEDYPLGQDIVEALGLSEQVVDFEITPNRPDCLSMLGMARETAAVFQQELAYPQTECSREQGSSADYISIEIRKPELCRRYAGRVVTDVKIGPSPWWLQKRLIHAGMRPINNIVDITNYVMLEYGQPLHAFDIRTLAGNRIIVDTANEGDSFVTLDGTTRQLAGTTLMINDGEKPVAIAGIMGGLNSEIAADTTTILIESANFNGDNIRSSSKKLGLRTEASARFEKGIDANLCVTAADRVCKLIEDLGIGQVQQGTVDVYPNVQKAEPVSVRVERVLQVLGVDLSAKEIEDLFQRLEMKTLRLGNTIQVTPPTVRQDLLEEIDFVEEVARLYGYDKMPSTLPKGNSKAGKSKFHQLRDLTRDTLVALGASEIQTYSFVSPKGLDNIRIPQDNPARNQVKLINPLGEENSVMRTMLLPNMLDVLARNFSRNIAGVKAFEIGNTFLDLADSKDGLPTEVQSLVLGCYGPQESFFTLKGVVEELCARLGVEGLRFQTESAYPAFHPGRTARICHGEDTLGMMGEIHPDVQEKYGLGTRAYCCEIQLPGLYRLARVETLYQPLPKYPAMVRDIALLVKEDTRVAELEAVIREQGGSLLEHVALFDIYRGKQVTEGMKSVAFTLTYRDREKTLTEAEVSAVNQKVLEQLASQCGAVLREL